MKDFTFSDGTRLPAGCAVSIPLWAMHYDEVCPELFTFMPCRVFSQPTTDWISINPFLNPLKRHYKDPNEFKPFRFSDMRDTEENGNIKHQMVTLNSDYFQFGAGRHAW